MTPQKIYLTLEEYIRLNEQIENILRDLKDDLSDKIRELDCENHDIKRKIRCEIEEKFQNMI